LPSAQHDAQDIAGLYESSRRIEHGFLSFFYLLQQTSIGANADGTISAPGGPGAGGDVKMKEVGPQIWREENGTREIALRDVDGVKTVMDSTDPTSVLQAVPFARSETLNLPVLLGSVAVLVWSLVLWPLSWLLRRGDHAQAGADAEVRRLRLFQRFACVVAVAYLGAWVMLLLPVLSLQLQFYSFRIDTIVFLMECAGALLIAAAAASLWVTWRLFNAQTPRLSLIWNGLVSVALLGLVWISVMGGLQGINLNY
jgi:hypothetical protein